MGRLATKVRNMQLVDGVGYPDIDYKIGGFRQMQLMSNMVNEV